MDHLVIRVYGRVQGVFFRHNAKKAAEVMGLCGYVKNMNDGSVLIEVEGDNDRLDLFISWCKKGASGAEVEKIVVENAPYEHYRDFRIIS